MRAKFTPAKTALSLRPRSGAPGACSGSHPCKRLCCYWRCPSFPAARSVLGARGAHRISKSPHILDVRLPSPKPTRVANHPVPTIAHVARAPAEPLVTLAHWGRSCHSSTACACDVPMPCSRTAQIASAALACRALPPFLRRPRTSRSTTTTTVCARVSRSNR